MCLVAQFLINRLLILLDILLAGDIDYRYIPYDSGGSRSFRAEMGGSWTSDSVCRATLTV